MNIDEKIKTITLSFIFQQAAANMLGKDIYKAYEQRPENKELEQKMSKGLLRKLLVNKPKFLLSVMFGAKETAEKQAKDVEEFLADKLYMPFLDYAEKMMSDIYPVIDKDKFFEKVVPLAHEDEREQKHEEYSNNLDKWIAIFAAEGRPVLHEITSELKNRMNGAPTTPLAPKSSKSLRSRIILK